MLIVKVEGLNTQARRATREGEAERRAQSRSRFDSAKTLLRETVTIEERNDNGAHYEAELVLLPQDIIANCRRAITAVTDDQAAQSEEALLEVNDEILDIEDISADVEEIVSKGSRLSEQDVSCFARVR